MALKLGAQLLTYGASWDDAMQTGRLLDRLGYDYLWGHDHLYSTGGDPYQPFFEGWTTLMAWAMTTERIRLGLLVGANTFRNPGVVAKMAATIDHASGGRSILGLGAGNVAFENLAHGIDPGETLGQRIDWFEESLAIIRDLLAGQRGHPSERQVPVRPRSPRAAAHPATRSRSSSAPRARSAVSAWSRATPTSGSGSRGPTRWSCSSTRTASCAITAMRRGATRRTIERMLGCKFIIRSSADEAGAVADALIAVHKWPPSIRQVVWAGTPQQVADWLTPFVEAGAGSFSPQIGWPYDHETIERLVSEVKPLVDGRTG